MTPQSGSPGAPHGKAKAGSRHEITATPPPDNPLASSCPSAQKGSRPPVQDPPGFMRKQKEEQQASDEYDKLEPSSSASTTNVPPYQDTTSEMTSVPISDVLPYHEIDSGMSWAMAKYLYEPPRDGGSTYGRMHRLLCGLENDTEQAN